MNYDVPTTASDYFGGLVRSYDSLIQRAVPRYHEMIDALLLFIPPTAGRVLELGCGTGNFTLPLAMRCPTAQIIAVDASTEMIQALQARPDSADPISGGRLKFLAERFEDLSFPAGTFDLVTSCISLHHVVDKASLFRNIHSWLKPGGGLRMADQFRGATGEIHEINWSRWLEFCRESGRCNEVEIRSLLDHAAAHDYYESIHKHFTQLEEAGFQGNSLDCVWRNLIWGVVVADR